MKWLPTILRRLGLSERGVAAVEFAIILPFLLTALLYGGEMAWYMMVQLRVSQATLQIADNASRIGDSSTLTNRKIYEGDVNDVMLGADLSGGKVLMICPLLSGPISILELATKEEWNGEEAQAGRDHRQVA